MNQLVSHVNQITNPAEDKMTTKRKVLSAKRWQFGKLALLGNWAGPYVWTNYGWMKREMFEANTKRV